jgi:hypothetical protein
LFAARELAERVPFWDMEPGDLLKSAVPLNDELLEHYRQEQLTIHWRLNKRTMDGNVPMDLVEAIRICNWDQLNGDNLEFIENDLAIGGVPISELSEDNFRSALSTTMERHIAINWLTGSAILYSDVSPDT